MKKQQLSKVKTSKFLPKRHINFFKYPSLEPNQINTKEMMALLNNADLDKASAKIRKQARSISTSISLVNGFFEMLASEIYGEKGFILDITTKEKELNSSIQNAFYEWEQRADKNSVFDFEDFESLVLNALFRDGEAFIRLHRENELKLEFIDADEIDNDLTDENKNIYYGIEFETNSQKPKIYHRKLKNNKYALIQAKNIIHIKKSHLACQKRGVSILASAIFDTHSKDKFKKAELDRARLASEITGFFTRKNEAGVANIEFDENGEPIVEDITLPETAQIGKMGYLGDDIQPHFIDPHNPTNIEFFLKSTDRDVARSLGISYATFTGDLRDVNYSSIRHGAIAERRVFKRLQNYIKRKFHNVVFLAWLECELINGKISAIQYELIKSHFNFKSEGWEYIDPVKEVNANKIAVDAGFKTIAEVLREKGVEFDAYMDELEKERKIVEKLREIKNIKEGKSENKNFRA